MTNLPHLYYDSTGRDNLHRQSKKLVQASRCTEMDPLSQVLSLLRPESYISGGYKLPSEVGIRFPEHKGIKCYAVVQGECWLKLEGASKAFHLGTGDCYLLPPGRSFRLGKSLALPVVSLEKAKAAGLWNGTGAMIDDDECFIVGGHFVLTGSDASFLLSYLPSVVHLKAESDKISLHALLQQLEGEVRTPQPGGSLIAQQLACTLLIKALRLHMVEEANNKTGWLFALADQRMRSALTSIHDNPGHLWRLEELASRAGMSRSSFAERFHKTVGSTPIEYLTKWRMKIAADRLQSPNSSISTISRSLGYESESAFGKTFKRVIGCSPKQFSRREESKMRSAMTDPAL